MRSNNMSNLFCGLVVILLLVIGICSGDFKQEGAKVVYLNPKYGKDLTLITIRENRNSPYLSSMNVTSLVGIADNVTIRLDLKNSNLRAFPIRFEFKACEGLKMKWIKDWLQAYSNVPIECPIAPARYYFKRFELPPKNMPIQFNNADYSGKCLFYVTHTKERMCEFSIELKFNNKKG